MSALLEILLRARDEMTPAMKTAVSEVERLGSAVEQTDTKLAAVGRGASALAKIDSAGRQGRIGLMALAQAADLVGVNIGGIVAPAAMAVDAVGDIAGAVSSLGMAATGVGLLIAALGAAKFAVDAYNKSIADNLMYNDRYLQDAHQIAAGNAILAASFLALKEARTASAQIGVDDLIRSNPQFSALNQGLTALGLGFKDMDIAAREAMNSFEALAWGAQSGYDALEKLRGASDFAASSASQHAAAESERSNALALTAAAAASAAIALAQVDGNATRAGTHLTDDARALEAVKIKAAQWNAGQTRLNETLQSSIGTVGKYGDAVAQAASKLRGMVEGALNATTVEQRLQMAGDAWDEFRLRLEAVATGTDPSQYGAEFVAQMNALGMSAAQAAAAFKDFSLFSDPANIKLVNFGPIVAEVQHQLDMMIGKANLTSAAMSEVWKNLSPQQKSALGAQGIDNVTDAVIALINPAQHAEQNVSELGAAVKAVPTAVTTTFAVKKEELFDDTLKDILDAINMIPTEITIAVGLANNIPTADGGTTTPPPPEIPKYAEGGYVPSTGLAVLHAGEYVLPRAQVQGRAPTSNYAFGGVTISGNTFVIRNDADIDRIANALARRWGRNVALRSAMRI